MLQIVIAALMVMKRSADFPSFVSYVLLGIVTFLIVHLKLKPMRKRPSVLRRTAFVYRTSTTFSISGVVAGGGGHCQRRYALERENMRLA
jgi:hypothetical protein